jgi:hypothetical protein
MAPETKTDCETKKHLPVCEKLVMCNCYKEFAALDVWHGDDIFCLSPETT